MANELIQIYVSEYDYLINFKYPLCLKKPNSILNDRSTIINDLSRLSQLNKVFKSLNLGTIPLIEYTEAVEEVDDTKLTRILIELNGTIENRIGKAISKLKNLIGGMNVIPDFNK